MPCPIPMYQLNQQTNHSLNHQGRTRKVPILVQLHYQQLLSHLYLQLLYKKNHQRQVWPMTPQILLNRGREYFLCPIPTHRKPRIKRTNQWKEHIHIILQIQLSYMVQVQQLDRQSVLYKSQAKVAILHHHQGRQQRSMIMKHLVTQRING